MNNPYERYSRSKHYHEERLQEARSRHLIGEARANVQYSLVRVAARWVIAGMLLAAIVALAGAKPAETAFPEEAFPSNHSPIAFEKDGDIWVASKMHLANLTPT